jgi:hypothetical protein
MTRKKELLQKTVMAALVAAIHVKPSLERMVPVSIFAATANAVFRPT